MKKVYLSGLGMMGRRHIKGLVRAGANVTAFDPSTGSHEKALADLAAANLPNANIKFVTEPACDNFDAAIFSETAAWRYGNVAQFLSRGRAGRYLLEKPLSADPQEIQQLPALFKKADTPIENVFVNFPRRLWDISARLRELVANSTDIQVTINGGAFGFGCNGIHYLDAFLHLCDAADAEVLFSEVDELPVASGRGTQFRDYGGRFLLRSEKATLFCSASASSSAPVLVTVRGDHFIALVDETDLTWKVLQRSPACELPNYRYGADYAVIEQGPFAIDNLDVVTERWLTDSVALPSLSQAIPAHRLLHRILEVGGVKPPFQYT